MEQKDGWHHKINKASSIGCHREGCTLPLYHIFPPIPWMFLEPNLVMNQSITSPGDGGIMGAKGPGSLGG